MSRDEQMIKLHADRHTLLTRRTFRSKEAYVAYLIRRTAYEKAARLARNRTVLDVGCNIGYGTHIVGDSCREIIGVDVSPKAISIATDLYGRRGVSFQVIDGKRLSFEDGRFDLVVSFQVIEHVVNCEDYLSEIRRVLSSGGLAMFTTPNRVLRLDPGMQPLNPFHVREFSAGELEDLLADFFGGVQVYGLFADEPLYSIEFNRLAQRREHARKTKGGITSFCYSLRYQVRKWLPAYLVERLKDVRDAVTGVHLDEDFQRQYTTKDFYYRNSDLDRALDLLAICGEDKKSLEPWIQDNSRIVT